MMQTPMRTTHQSSPKRNPGPWALSCLFALSLAVHAAPLKVMVSILPQQYFVERIGGDRVEARTLVQPGQDPHIFEPSPRQMVFLSEADVFFRIGMEFEEGLMPRLQSVVPDLKVVDLRDGIELMPMACEAEGHEHGHAHDHDMPDPHTWTDPALALQQARLIAETLSELDPDGQATYASNVRQLEQDLTELQTQLKEAFAAMPGLAFMVYHPSWGYLAHSLGLEQISIEVSGKAPGARQLVRIIDRARAEGIRVIFVQPQFDQRAAERIAAAIGGVVIPLDPLAYDYIANMETVAAEIRKAIEP